MHSCMHMDLMPFSPVLLSDPHRHSQDESWVFGAAAKGNRGKADRADRAHSRAGCFRLAQLQLPSRIPSGSPLTNPACLSRPFATLWNGATVVRRPRQLVCVNTTSVAHFRAATPPLNQGYNPLTVALSLCLSVLPWSVLTCPLPCLFSLFLSADSHWHTEN